jgi:hypothetical protein
MSYEAGPQGIQGATGPTGATGSAPPVYQASYYKTVAQTLTSGNTDITFDGVGVWSNTGGYITQISGTKDFTVVQTGIYQLEFNATILANGATWLTTSNKSVAIDVTKGSELAVIINSALQASGLNYAQCLSATYYLEAGDVINLRIGNTFTGGPATTIGINGFDLNTFFTWRFIS